MDFAILPPEINSGLIYAGPGAGPLLGAAAAWDSLSADLTVGAQAYGSAIGTLDGTWIGPSASAMQTSATRYLSWMTETAEMASISAQAAMAAASAYQAALSSVVSPPVIAANRAELLVLVATNLLGQNSGLIAINQAEYAEMWAQDAAAMYAYQAESAAATSALPQFNPAPQVSNPVDIAQPSAVGLSDPVSSIWNWLTSPDDFLSALNNPATPIGFVEAQWLSTSSSGPWQSLFFLLTAGLMGQANGYMDQSNGLTWEGNRISERLAYTDEQQIGHPIVNPGEAPTYPGNSPKIAERPAFGVGTSHTAGALSVPPNWDKSTQQVRLASSAAPLPSGGGMIPTPIAAVNAPKKERKKGEDVLQVKLILPKGV